MNGTLIFRYRGDPSFQKTVIFRRDHAVAVIYEELMEKFRVVLVTGTTIEIDVDDENKIDDARKVEILAQMHEDLTFPKVIADYVIWQNDDGKDWTRSDYFPGKGLPQ